MENRTRVVISNNPESLKQALAGKTSATVEAEYGDTLVEGELATLAHHIHPGNLPPCLFDNFTFDKELEIIGLSHFDLDTIGGVAALLNQKPRSPSFWTLAAFVDVKGPHRRSQAGASQEDLRRLDAWHAWSSKSRVVPPRDGSVLDVTEEIAKAIQTIQKIIDGDEELLLEGERSSLEREGLNKSSFRRVVDGAIIVREANCFVNDLYISPGEEELVAKAVVAFNTSTEAITISFADPIPGCSCKDIVQALWGPLAGGHAGIAGSPRGQKMTRADVDAAAEALQKSLQPPRPVLDAEGNPRYQNINLIGFLIPCEDEEPTEIISTGEKKISPVLLQMPGTDDLFLPIFSSEEKLHQFFGQCGLRFTRLRQITSHGDFIESLSRLGTPLRIAIDVNKLPNGRIRFMEVPLPIAEAI